MKTNLYLIFLILVFLVIGSVFGKISFDRYIAAILPVPKDFISSMVFDNLFVNISGIIVDKNEDYFDLRSNDKMYKIYIEEDRNITGFERNGVRIRYQDVEVGLYIKGGISIVPRRGAAREFPDRQPGDIIGHYFQIP